MLAGSISRATVSASLTTVMHFQFSEPGRNRPHFRQRYPARSEYRLYAGTAPSVLWPVRHGVYCRDVFCSSAPYLGNAIPGPADLTHIPVQFSRCQCRRR